METENASIQAINSIRVACNCQTSRMSHHHNSHLFPPNKHTTAQATWTERSQQFAITKSKREREREMEIGRVEKKQHRQKYRKTVSVEISHRFGFGDNINFVPINMLRVRYLCHYAERFNFTGRWIVVFELFRFRKLFQCCFFFILSHKNQNNRQKVYEILMDIFSSKKTIIHKRLSSYEQYSYMQPSFLWIAFKFHWINREKKMFK